MSPLSPPPGLFGLQVTQFGHSLSPPGCAAGGAEVAQGGRCPGGAGTHPVPMPGEQSAHPSPCGSAVPKLPPALCQHCRPLMAAVPPTEATGWPPAWKIPVSRDAQDKNRLFEARLLRSLFGATFA